MFKLFKKKTKESLPTSQNAGNTENNSASGVTNTKLVDRHQVATTPFTLVKFEGENYWQIVMGNYKVSDKTFTTKDKAMYYIAQKPWELLAVVILILQKTNLENNN